jgi:SHS2 domain-containing protein
MGERRGLLLRRGQTGARYVLLDHPADLGIEARGDTLSEAFENAAAGLMAIILDPARVVARESREVCLSAVDQEQLLVRWLSEILYLYDGEGFVSAEFSILELGPDVLTATIRGEEYAPGVHVSRMDVKAVTYHQLEVEGGPSGGRIKVYLDI